jgi:hypothetical protein
MANKTTEGGYEGLNVPLYPADGFTITQMTASSAYDILTIKQAATATGAPISVIDSTDTQKFAVTKNYGLKLNIRTTRPTTGLVKGEVLLLFHGSTPKIGICSSTGAQTIKLIRAKTKSFGRLTA